ncbi:BRISC complex subunit Abraxas 2-like [Gigantopelta aegis]|uniref:BRISC complex subunit Abraxas 2-like n=1 Tax=Gigantopelta aegis TaxID=1735272 RepID=UPI001B887765|nr:BRISC complex subunit Abraxas 2-like [Gigantopelta aegis]
MAAHGSGALFASLFFDQINSPSDQEGFLLGKIIDQVHDRISDSQISNYKVETRVCIYSYLPWPRVQKLYNHAGQFSIDLLKQFLDGKETDVIGWYKFRRNSTLRPSLKESTLHCNLIYSLSLEYDQPENFLFFLCSTFTSQNLATHSYDHCFLKHHHGKFHRIPVQIVNLGDTTHASYRQQPNLGINPESGTLHSVLHRFRDDFVMPDGKMLEVKRIRSISASVNEKLQSLAVTVLQSELKLGSLEAEVDMLTKRLVDKEKEHNPAKPLPPTSPPPPYMEIFNQTPSANRIKIHSMRSDMKYRRSIGDSDGGVRQVRQMSLDEDEYNPPHEKFHPSDTSKLNVKEFDIIEGPENLCQGMQETSIADQSISYPPDITTAEKTPAVSESDTTARMSTRRRTTAAAKTGPLRINDVGAGSSGTADHFSFVNNVLEKEKHAGKHDDSMAIPVGDKIKLPPSSDGMGNKSRTHSAVKSTGKHKLYTPSHMGEAESGPEYNINSAASVSKAKSHSRDAEMSKLDMSGNIRPRTRQGHGQRERVRPRENYNGDCVNDSAGLNQRCQPARSCSPRNRQIAASKTNTTLSDGFMEQERSKEAKQRDSLDISSSPVF